jgi:DNA-binding response OmpR family regulator
VMPGLGGRELARRGLALRPGLRLLFVSGYVPAIGDDGLGAPEAFLAKPFEADELVARVRALLDDQSTRTTATETIRSSTGAASITRK